MTSSSGLSCDRNSACGGRCGYNEGTATMALKDASLLAGQDDFEGI